MSPHFYISETFVSIQGEGNCAGALSLFVRFQHCNLTCSWCDSKYAWGENEMVKIKSAEEIRAEIEASSAPNVILTGGEPCLYQLDSLVVPDKKFHVETNGTLIPTEELSLILPDGKTMKRTAMQADVISKFNWVVSPKMNNARQKLNRTAMNYWVKETACIFKFIIQNRSDITEIEEVEKQFNIPKQRIFIGLEGVTAESQTQPDLVDEIIQKGYNFSPRLHILLWGTRRGK